MNNAILFRRRGKIYLPPTTGTEPLTPVYVASLIKNLESLGFTLSEPLIQACNALSLEQLADIYQELVKILTEAKGADHEFQPMYPNFPAQVMETEKSLLYLNAMLHYLTVGRYMPSDEKEKRLPLLDNVELTVLEPGTIAELETICGQIVASNTSLSGQDQEDLAWFVTNYRDDIRRLLPETIKQKENMAYMAGLLIRHTTIGFEFSNRYCQTATDTLRIAVALSGGDISLAGRKRFGRFSRAERRHLLSLVDRHPNAVEDILRWKGHWLRLGERLHPGEFRSRYPRAAAAFDVIRNDIPHPTFNSAVETAIAGRDTEEALKYLRSRPGDFARRLNHLMHVAGSGRELVLTEFAAVADKVSTPVLLQINRYFTTRDRMHRADVKMRTFFPKGNLAKIYAIENKLPQLPPDICLEAIRICRNALIDRFRSLPPLGACYLDKNLANYIVPFSQRSASKSFRTLVRGSRIPLPEDCRVLRFFVWWRNGISRTDIDLSVVMFDKDFGYCNFLAYYNLQDYGGCHSGDIVDAPDGASEFIDVTLENLLASGMRYVVMSLNSFTKQPYSSLPECFAGWMSRTHPDSGEVYEPLTVRDRVDITANTRIAIPLIIDVEKRNVIWCDMALRSRPSWSNNVHANMKGTNLILHAFAELQKASLYDLLELHIAARGSFVEHPHQADNIFSVESGLPFRLEEIAAEYMQ